MYACRPSLACPAGRFTPWRHLTKILTNGGITTTTRKVSRLLLGCTDVSMVLATTDRIIVPWVPKVAYVLDAPNMEVVSSPPCLQAAAGDLSLFSELR